MKVIVEKEWYSIKMCKDNPQNCYVFGENEEQQGTFDRGSGQAIIRGQDNTYGFCTKKSIYKYWTDTEYSDNIIAIETDIKRLVNIAKNYVIVFPYNGLGTGLSKLPYMAPKTFLYLSRRLLDVFGFNNLENLKSE
jgi:hypothetical protein